jgi:hypothetical protein
MPPGPEQNLLDDVLGHLMVTGGPGGVGVHRAGVLLVQRTEKVEVRPCHADHLRSLDPGRLAVHRSASSLPQARGRDAAGSDRDVALRGPD